MGEQAVMSKLVEEGAEDKVCFYCKYESGCPRGVVSYGDGPIFPPCVDLPAKEWFDLESYLEDEKEEDE